MAPKQLNFITGNKNKLIEVQAILGDTVDLKSQSLDLIEIQGTIDEVSIDKCRRAAEAVLNLLPMVCKIKRINVTHRCKVQYSSKTHVYVLNLLEIFQVHICRHQDFS